MCKTGNKLDTSPLAMSHSAFNKSLLLEKAKYNKRSICLFCLLKEIDGQSLLLLKRLDVLTGLSFKLGPALKIYKHVSRLQLHHTENTGEGQSSCAA